MPIRGRHVGLIAAYSTKYSIRGGVGLIFTLLALLFGLMVAHTLISPVEATQARIQREAGGDLDDNELREKVLGRLVDLARPAVGWVLGSQSIEDIEDPAERAQAEADMEAWKAYLLDEHPALLSAILLILMWGWPFIVAAGAFDVFAGDIASRGLRYQLLRADRGSIFVGRVLGMLVMFVFVLALLMVTVTGYMGAKLPFFGWGALIPWAAYGLFALAVISIPYLALCAWLSACFGSSMTSLVMTSAVIGGVPFFALIARNTYEPAAVVIHALPWGIQRYAFHPDLGVRTAALGGCLGYAAVFLFLGYRKFTTRDL